MWDAIVDEMRRATVARDVAARRRTDVVTIAMFGNPAEPIASLGDVWDLVHGLRSTWVRSAPQVVAFRDSSIWYVLEPEGDGGGLTICAATGDEIDRRVRRELQRQLDEAFPGREPCIPDPPRRLPTVTEIVAALSPGRTPQEIDGWLSAQKHNRVSAPGGSLVARHPRGGREMPRPARRGGAGRPGGSRRAPSADRLVRPGYVDDRATSGGVRRPRRAVRRRRRPAAAQRRVVRELVLAERGSAHQAHDRVDAAGGGSARRRRPDPGGGARNAPSTRDWPMLGIARDRGARVSTTGALPPTGSMRLWSRRSSCSSSRRPPARNPRASRCDGWKPVSWTSSERCVR